MPPSKLTLPNGRRWVILNLCNRELDKDEMASSRDIADWIKQKASQAGFDACAITSASLPAQTTAYLDEFIAQGYHGEMTWLAETRDRRASPDAMWQEAQSAIVLAMNYGPDHDPLLSLSEADKGNISVYARGRDYHDVIKGKLKQLAGQFAAYVGADVKVFVDTAPLLEKPLAAQAGLGWQGKHSNMVSRDFGSWVFLGTILTTAALPYDTPMADHCGSCTSCLDICPTQAFPRPYQLDARRCISYMTIEQDSQIAHDYRPLIGNRIFGCDDCLAACPWNKFASAAAEQKLHPRHDPALWPLETLLKMDEALFRSTFAGMPVRRAGYEKFMRNVLIAAGNAKESALIPLIIPFLTAEAPLMRGMAIWALSCYQTPEAMQQYYQLDTDPEVEAEWQRALTSL